MLVVDKNENVGAIVELAPACFVLKSTRTFYLGWLDSGLGGGLRIIAQSVKGRR